MPTEFPAGQQSAVLSMQKICILKIVISRQIKIKTRVLTPKKGEQKNEKQEIHSHRTLGECYLLNRCFAIVLSKKQLALI